MLTTYFPIGEIGIPLIYSQAHPMGYAYEVTLRELSSNAIEIDCKEVKDKYWCAWVGSCYCTRPLEKLKE